MVSKFPEAKIVPKTDAAHTIGVLEDIYTAYGNPTSHRTDNGPPFNSKEFQSFSESRGIRHDLSFPYHPQANPVECLMKPLGKAMKAAHFEGKDKGRALNNFLATYRATPHKATGIAPGDVLFRHGYMADFPKTAPPSNEEVREALEVETENRSQRNESLNTHRREESYNIGDSVVTRNENKNKFDPTFGPEPMVVTATEPGGVTCSGQNGASQRRHLDDVKHAPAMASEDQDSMNGQETHADTHLRGDEEDGETDNEEIGEQLVNAPTDPNPRPKRPVRDRRPNPKYKDFILY
jgi:hypothetical protein